MHSTVQSNLGWVWKLSHLKAASLLLLIYEITICLFFFLFLFSFSHLYPLFLSSLLLLFGSLLLSSFHLFYIVFIPNDRGQIILTFSIQYPLFSYLITLFSRPVLHVIMAHQFSPNRKPLTYLTNTWRNCDPGLSSPPASPIATWSSNPDSYLRLLQRAYISLNHHSKGKSKKKKNIVDG